MSDQVRQRQDRAGQQRGTVSTLGGLAFVLLFACVTRNFVFDTVDRVTVSTFFDIGSVGGQL